MLANWQIVLRRYMDIYWFYVQGLLYVWNALIFKFILYELYHTSVIPTRQIMLWKRCDNVTFRFLQSFNITP